MRKKGFRYSVTMRIIQHILAAFVVFIIIYSVVGTSVVINSAGKDVSYNLYESDKSRSYEESYLFNNILGNNMSNVFRLVAEGTQLETKGQDNGKKVIDVTAYASKGSVSPGD